jgi:hypothetical protein
VLMMSMLTIQMSVLMMVMSMAQVAQEMLMV